MAKQKIEPRFDGDRASEFDERFVVGRSERAADRDDSSEPESEAGSTRIYLRLAWMILFVCAVVLSWELLKWYADASESQVLSDRIEGLQQDFAAARRQMLNLPVRHILGSSDSAKGRELRRQCEDLSRAFVASPTPRARELMLAYCQAYEQYQETGKVPRNLPDAGR